MADPAEVLEGLNTKYTEHARVQQDWIAASAAYAHRAAVALEKAEAVLAEDVRDSPPDARLAQTWAMVGQGWATISHAEAARSIAIAAPETPHQIGANVRG